METFGVTTDTFRPYWREPEHPTDRPGEYGRQLMDAWEAEHGDEPYPT